jgi:hypothetical protein
MKAIALLYNNKPSKLRAYLFGGIGALICTSASIFFKIKHAPSWVPIALFGVGMILLVFGIRQTIINFHAKAKTANRWFMGLLLGAILISVFEVCFQYQNQPLPEESFKVALDIGPDLEPNDLFGTKLILQNLSQESISQICFTTYWKDSEGPAKHLNHVLSGIVADDELKPSMKLTLGIRPLGSPPPVPLGKRTFVQIEITYIPKLWKNTKTDRFQFCVLRDSNNGFLWLPAGEGKTLKEFFESAVLPKSILDTIPFLMMNVTGIEKIDPKQNKGCELQLNYDVCNVGGMPAVNHRTQWTAIDALNGRILGWTNHFANTEDLIWPWHPWNFSTKLGKTIDSNFYEGILSGRLTMVGRTYYQDIEKHEYAIILMAIHTNNQFEVKYVDLQGHFRELPGYTPLTQ